MSDIKFDKTSNFGGPCSARRACGNIKEVWCSLEIDIVANFTHLRVHLALALDLLNKKEYTERTYLIKSTDL